MKLTLKMLLLCLIVSCATAPTVSLTSNGSKVLISKVRFSSIDGCSLVDSYEVKDSNPHNIYIKAQNYASTINANFIAMTRHDQVSDKYFFEAFNCEKSAMKELAQRNLEVIDRENRYSQYQNQVEQQRYNNTLRALQQMNQTLFPAKPEQPRSPARTKCRTVKRDYMGQIQYETSCQEQ